MREQAGMERTCEVVGIAVISAIFSRPDIREAARELRTAVDTALKEWWIVMELCESLFRVFAAKQVLTVSFPFPTRFPVEPTVHFAANAYFQSNIGLGLFSSL